MGDGPVRLKDLPFGPGDGPLQKENMLKAIEEEMPLEEALVILNALKAAKDEGRTHMSRKGLVQMCSKGEMTEQMMRNRLGILARYGLVVIKKGPKGTRLSLDGEECIGIIKKHLEVG